jgi:tartrate-resistant acid phosphatase type 5
MRNATWMLLVICAACGPTREAGRAGGASESAEDGTDVDAPPPLTAPLRFVALGDSGNGNESQRRVAEAVKSTCAAEGCDFALLLGDNLYEDGADSLDDPVWQSSFEVPYADLDLPFYAVLGNHDYGGELLFIDFDGLGNEFERGPVEVAYSSVSSKWRMPATHYTQRFGPVGLIALDTNSILWDNTEHGDQRAFFPAAVAGMADATWVIAAGHHPYLSNGDHGNAGSYHDLLGIPIPIDELTGDDVKEFFDDLVCGSVDVYLSGHDHNHQWMNEPGACAGTELIVTGASSEVKDLDDRERNAVHYQDDSGEGFLHVVIDGPTFTGRFYDANGAVRFERTLTK